MLINPFKRRLIRLLLHFCQVLDFIYTGQLPSSHHVSDQGVSALLRAASYLQLSGLATLCRRKLKPRRPSNPPSSTTSSLTPNSQPQVTHSYRSGSTEDGKSHKQMQVELQRKDLSEEELFTTRCASPELVEMNDSVETRLRLELIGVSPSSSRLQQSPPPSSSNSTSSDDNTEQWYPSDSQQMAVYKRPRSTRDNCLEGSIGTKRQEVGSGEPELKDHAEVREEDLALNNELDGNTQASYIYHQPQPGFALQGSLYMCIPCGEGFPSSEQLIVHVESHTAEQLMEDAEEGILIKVDVEDPERFTDMRPSCHVCSVCSQSYVDAALLRQHERSHRSFSCDVCGKMFTQRGTMTRHMRSHLGLKPFACDECGMRFTRQYRKMEHMRIHTREKPYEFGGK
ncbi:hypermethylated in cancer 2 protein [Thunnus thynnus]|uniref:hypermethylated in cancer 2 protein n=1 Tax=Thunnus thynnus TaxID=8237 RepID=UPI003528C822